MTSSPPLPHVKLAQVSAVQPHLFVKAAYPALVGVVLGQDGPEVVARAGDHDAPARRVCQPGPLCALRAEGLLRRTRDGLRSRYADTVRLCRRKSIYVLTASMQMQVQQEQELRT